MKLSLSEIFVRPNCLERVNLGMVITGDPYIFRLAFEEAEASTKPVISVVSRNRTRYVNSVDASIDTTLSCCNWAVNLVNYQLIFN